MHAMSSPTRLLVSAVALLFIVTTNIIVVVDAASNGIQFLVNFDDGTANDLLGKHHGALQGGGTSINNGFATLTNGLIRFANPTTLDFSTSYTRGTSAFDRPTRRAVCCVAVRTISRGTR
jgi:hypothetical protein